VYNTIHIEDSNTPAVALCQKDFITDGKSAASGKGMPFVRLVPEAVPCECTVKEEIEAGVEAVMDDIVAALSQPLTAEEQSPEPKDIEKSSRVVFKGNLEKEYTAVSVFFPNCSARLMPYGTDDRGILSGVCYNLLPSRRGLFGFEPNTCQNPGGQGLDEERDSAVH